MSRSVTLPVLLVALVVAGIACGDRLHEGDRQVAVWVGDDAIYVDEVEQYLDANLVAADEDEEVSPGAMDEVRSRLLDAMIDERLFHDEAERRGIGVSDLEVRTYLELDTGETPEDAEERPWRETEARRRLRVQKLQEEIVREQPEPSDEEVATYAREHAETLLPAQPLSLRALQLDSMDEARRIYNEIRRKRMTFNEAVLAHESSPGQAQPLQMSWDGLSPDLGKALRKLEPGQVSEPLELHGSIYLFQVVAWLDGPGDHDAEVARRARYELEALRRREALESLAERLRKAHPPRIRTEALPFRYVPETATSAVLAPFGKLA